MTHKNSLRFRFSLHEKAALGTATGPSAPLSPRAAARAERLRQGPSGPQGLKRMFTV